LYSKEYKKDEPSISESTLQYLLRYKWPGNIDELKKNLKAAVLLADNEINQEHFSLLPNFFDEQFDSDDAKVSIYDLEFDKGDLNLEFMERIYQFKNGSLEELDYDKILDEFEKFVFQIALNKTYGNKAKAASLLNLKPGKFLYKTKYLGL
jgi:DNA-binding NtrC family response regulator